MPQLYPRAHCPEGQRAEHHRAENRKAAPTHPTRQSNLCRDVDGCQDGDPRNPCNKACGKCDRGLFRQRKQDQRDSCPDRPARDKSVRAQTALEPREGKGSAHGAEADGAKEIIP